MFAVVAMMLRRLRSGGRGAAMVELALALPVLLLLTAGIWDFGRVYSAYMVATNAAREGARWAALGKDETAVKDRVRAYIDSGDVSRADVIFNQAEVGITLPEGNQPGDPVTVTVPVYVDLFFAGITHLGEPCPGGSGTCLQVTGQETMRLQAPSQGGAAGTPTSTASPTSTPGGPTATPVPPTETPVPPTNTPVTVMCTCECVHITGNTYEWQCTGQPGCVRQAGTGKCLGQ